MLSTLFGALPADAQIKFGVKGGYNVSQVNLNGNLLNNIGKGNQSGFFAGLTVDANLPIGLGADIAALYDQKKICTELGTEEKLEYIDVPLNVKYTFGLGSIVSFYLATGPQFSFNIGDKDIAYFKYAEAYRHEFQMRKSEFSWNAGAGFTLFKHLRLGYNYNIAIDNTADLKQYSTRNYVEIATGELKNDTHQISLTYLF